MAIALIDGNNFYASCEQSIDPSLANHPLVILSNNDGCIIARSAEAKALGIPMGIPFFEIRDRLERLEVKVRSSNYALYGDMSQRFMSLLEVHCEELEIYSIDEAFARVKRPINNDLQPWAKKLRALIYQHLGLPIAIGIGTSKSQAKLANHLAKTIAEHAGIFDLEASKNLEDWLESIAIEDVWGIGHKISQWCRTRGITNARQLRDTPSNELKAKYGITAIRLQNELKGIACIPLLKHQKSKKETCVSRSFNKPITTIDELRQAISTYTVRASEKLRTQKQVAGTITIFARTSSYAPTFHSQAATKKLQVHSNDTGTLLATSLELTEKIFRPNHLLMKAGVIMQDLQKDNFLQLNLLEQYSTEEAARREKLLKTIDRLNKRYGRNAIQWAVCGINPKWSMQRKYLSPAATTKFTDIPIVNS